MTQTNQITTDNPIVTSFLAENKRHVDGDSAASICRIPDAAWPSVLAALDELSGGATDPGIDCAVASTNESLADFDDSRARHWSERGRRSEHEFGGFKAVKYESLQLARGQQRFDQIVIDLGDFRLVLF